MSTTHNIDSRVEIIPHEVEGIVDGIFTDRRGTQYLVEYKDKAGAIQSRYYAPEQLRTI
ncbi:hypothetical protein [Cupriavidus neocaledonicus]|uniref:Uncharacterized protein n=1 Tax=Cupriavidus neocaledonicus TaxID=1040979 RepID=A0A375H5Y2_9BURK|nr:hypothetical protein [Cupriavidus neocaledonicus]SOZ37712.1 hypothetical protein CBM2605_A80196 [Cupriavidus neocaledonicus]SPD46286.1 protein of unknown function [Cupriavidus neocaledonicus]